MIIVLLADGFEEIEALTPIDLLRRAGLEVKTVGMNGRVVCGSHNIPVICDLNPDEVDLLQVDLAIFPGGMPGAKNLDTHKFTNKVITTLTATGGRLAAICAAPFILGKRGILAGKKATCYPGFENELTDAEIVCAPVVTDGNITTASGMGASLEFAEELVFLMAEKNKADAISKAVRSLPKAKAEEDKPLIDVAHEALDLVQIAAATEKNETSKFDLSVYPTDIQETAHKILATFTAFGVKGEIKGVDIGPRIIRYEIVPARGTRVSSILNLENDISLNLAVSNIMMEAPIPGKTAIGITVPRSHQEYVELQELMKKDEFKANTSPTAVCIGVDVSGAPVIHDIAKMPHALITGATGMGKSNFIHAMIGCITQRADPAQVKFILIDPKQVEFNVYHDIPHLLTPIIRDEKRAAAALLWAVYEMDRRYNMLQKNMSRNISAYNEKVAANPELGEPVTQIIIVIDELANIMMHVKNPAETLIIHLAQKARAAGIHLVLGTQKPYKEIVSNIIKANIPSKFTCKLASSRDSIWILDSAGGEKLLNNGDMLISFANSLKPIRVQTPFISEKDIEIAMQKLKETLGCAKYDSEIMDSIDDEYKKIVKDHTLSEEDIDEIELDEELINNKQFIQAIEISVEAGKISTALIQRKLSIGYGKAARFIDCMEDMGIISKPCGSRPRKVLITQKGWQKLINKASRKQEEQNGN